MFLRTQIVCPLSPILVGLALMSCVDRDSAVPLATDVGGADGLNGAGGCECNCNCSCRKSTITTSVMTQGATRGGTGNTRAVSNNTSTSVTGTSSNGNRNLGGNATTSRSVGGAREIGDSPSKATSGGGARSIGGSSSTGGRTVCTDEPRPSESCKDAVAWGFCGQEWFAGNCEASCGVCSMGWSNAAGGTRAPDPPNTSGGSTAMGTSNVTVRSPATTTPVIPSTATQPTSNGDTRAAGGAMASGGATATGGRETVIATTTSATTTNAPTISVAACADGQRTLTSNGTGTHCGYTYEYWKDTGSGSLVLKPDGFSVDWSNINNLLGRKGLRPGSRSNVVAYEANYQPNGNSYLCVYGWTRSPLVEYYIVESWGTWRPPGGEGFQGTVTCDGATYDLYRVQRINQPSIDGITNFAQYFSVRQQKRTSGTITVGCHFDAWVSKGMTMGSLYEVSMTVEGYQSSGKADVKMSMR